MESAVPLLSRSSSRGRWALAATVLGSALAYIDATAVNVALPVIERDLGGGISMLQWIVNAYTLTLAAFILLGGALGDRFGRRRIFTFGTLWFTAASLACGLAPSSAWLVAARALQGVGAALLMPASLAILQSTFRPEDRASAIGAWSALGGISVAAGPFVGGWLVETFSWRWVFLMNIPIAVATMLISSKAIPETADPHAPDKLDAGGAALAVVGLGGVTWALTARHGPAGALSAAVVVAFLLFEKKRAAPMLDLSLFQSRTFSTANAHTLLLYAGLSAAVFLLPLSLQQLSGYSPVGAGAAMLPTTLLLLLGSERAARLSQRVGPRWPMTVGPLGAGAGMLILYQAGPRYALQVLPGAVVLGLGLATTVAPLTAAVLAAAPEGKAGVASAINNCVARVGGLLAVAVVPSLTGASGTDQLTPASFHRGMLFSAALCFAAAAIAFFGLAPERRGAGVPSARKG